MIIPPTDTPGAVGAGVPEYIDRVVSLNAEHQPLVRAGLAWLEQQAQSRFSTEFLALDEAEHVAILQPLSDEVDRQQRDAQRRRFRTEAQARRVYYVAVTDKTPPAPSAVARRVRRRNDPALPVRLFRLIKNLTADGYTRRASDCSRSWAIRATPCWPASRSARSASTYGSALVSFVQDTLLTCRSAPPATRLTP